MIGKAIIRLNNYAERNIIPFTIVYLMTGIIAGVITGIDK